MNTTRLHRRRREAWPVLGMALLDGEGFRGAPGSLASFSNGRECIGDLRWRVPRILKAESAFGRVHLDLSRAVIEHAVVDIESQLGTGRAKTTVPRDAMVDPEDLRTGWKDSLYKTRRASRPGGPTVRITGTMGFGRVKIRHARR